MKIKIAWLTLGLLTLTGVSAPAPAVQTTAVHRLNETDLAAFMDGMVPYAIERADIAGAVVVVVKGDKIVFQKGYGYSDVATRAPVIPDETLFRPGSISKLFTWTAVMQQVQAGKIDLDADVNRYLDFTIPPKYGKPITMRDLMTHTGGFAEVIRDLISNNPHRLVPLRQYLVQHVPERIFPPGKIIAYSNYGAALAGYIVQRVSGEPFDAYVQKHIFDPLRMHDATFVQPPPARLAALMAKGYVTASDKKPTPFEYVIAAPAGASSATGTDMAHFMIAYLNGGKYEGGEILNPQTIAQMFTPQVLPAPGMNGYDLGFYQENRNGQMIVGHGGDTDVFHSDLHLLPKQHIGIFMSFNSAGKAGAVESVRVQIFRKFLDRYFPYTPPAVSTVAHPERDNARVAGWYESSRREPTLALVYALGQISVSPNADGTVSVSALTNPAGTPLKWRDVGPLTYRQVNGQATLKFNTDANGNVISWTSDEEIPVFIFQRVNGLKSLGLLKPLIACFIVVLLVSLLIRLGGWIARRKLRLKLGVPPFDNWVHLAARIGAIAFLGALLGWGLTVTNEGALLGPGIGTQMMVLYAVGVVAIAGGVAMVLEALLRVAHGPGGWLVRIGEVIVALAAIYGIWLFLAFGLVSFSLNY